MILWFRFKGCKEVVRMPREHPIGTENQQTELDDCGDSGNLEYRHE